MIVNKILTESPIIDELVYYSKLMALDTIIKDSDEALKYGTFDSIKKSDLYIACIDGRATFLMFDNYTLDMMISVDLQPVEIREKCVMDKTLVPQQYRQALRDLALADYVSKYIELNDYYRRLNGIPNYTDTGVYPSTMDQSLAPGIYIKNYSGLPEDIDLTIPLHKYDKSIIELLREIGIIDQVKSDYPTKKYLNYLGNRKVSIYDARTAYDFGILYVPSIEISELYQKFKAHLEKNRVFVIKTVYNEAFKLNSDYYNKFITILIVIQSFVDMIIDAPEYLIRKEVFDIRTVQYIFEGYGIEYYKEIPLRYQVAMVKSLNKLLKYKSTTKNMIDICSLFGFEDINIFKYYLLKDRVTDENGDFIYNYKEVIEDGVTKTVEDIDKNYELKFFKMPIDGDVETYVRDEMSYSTYDDITIQDKYWDGDREHEEVKHDIINAEFNFVQSKYISIDSVYHLTNLSFERPYFFSVLFEEDRRADGIKVSVPYISTIKTFKFTDIICFLYSLMYEYYGIIDTIMDSTTGIMSVKGFNFKVDMAALSTYLMNNMTSLKETGIDGFKIPSGTILTFGQLIDIFESNRVIYEHVESQMYNAKDYKTYRIFKTIYESLMIHDENLKFFKKSDGIMAKSYFEFISDRDTVLADAITEIKNISTPDEKTVALINMINFTIQALNEYIDTHEYKHLFSDMPTESATAIQKYIYKVINFFKSYKIDILSINNIYKLDDTSNRVYIVDSRTITSTFSKDDNAKMSDNKTSKSSLNKNDQFSYTDSITKAVTTRPNDNVKIIEKIMGSLGTIEYADISVINDVFLPTINSTQSDKALDVLDKIWIKINMATVLGWTVSAVLNTPRDTLGGCGIQTSALSFGGNNGINPVSNSEKYDGTIWSNTGNINTAKYQLAGAGLQNAGLAFGGTINTVCLGDTELFINGLWSIGASLSTPRRLLTGCGLQNAALSVGGYITQASDITEKFNGTIWSNSGNLNTGRFRLAGCGDQTAAIIFGGYMGSSLNTTEKFNGSVWTSGPNLNNSNNSLAGCGTASLALAFGGYISSAVTAISELFNGTVWSTGSNLSEAKQQLSGCGTQNTGLAFGGTTSSAITGRTERYMK